MIKFHLRHRYLHHAISACALAILLALDAWVLFKVPSYFSSEVAAGVLAGLLHGYLMYSLAVYSLHEGAAHRMIVYRKGPVSNFFAAIAENLSRLTFAESDYYAVNHLSHHRNFATDKDDEFLHFVFSKRYARVFIPFAYLFNFTDFKSTVGPKLSRSRLLSVVLSLLVQGALALAMHRYYSWTTIVIAMVLVYPNFFFWLDRTRQYMEHNTMPLDVDNGARDLGLGFWGMLFGGGPWGQPCHWTHHLLAGLPWYNQLRLHRVIKKLLTEEQRKQFFLDPVFGFPRKLALIFKTTS